MIVESRSDDSNFNINFDFLKKKSNLKFKSFELNPTTILVLDAFKN